MQCHGPYPKVTMNMVCQKVTMNMIHLMIVQSMKVINTGKQKGIMKLITLSNVERCKYFGIVL